MRKEMYLLDDRIQPQRGVKARAQHFSQGIHDDAHREGLDVHICTLHVDHFWCNLTFT